MRLPAAVAASERIIYLLVFVRVRMENRSGPKGQCSTPAALFRRQSSGVDSFQSKQRTKRKQILAVC